MSEEPPARFRPVYKEPQRPTLVGVARDALADLRGALLPLALLALAVAGMALLGGRLLDPWLRHWALLDRVVELSRLPVTDDELRMRLVEAGRARGFGASLGASSFQIQTDQELYLRRVRARYHTVDEPVPGWSRRLEWHIDVHEPVLFRPLPRHY